MLTLEGVALLCLLALAGALWQRRLLMSTETAAHHDEAPDGFSDGELGESGRSSHAGASQISRVDPWGTFDFAVPDAGQAAVVDRIVRVVDPHAVPPQSVAGWYVKQRAGDHLVFGFGTRLGDRILVVVAVGGRQFDCIGRTEVLMSSGHEPTEAPVTSSWEMACLYDRIRSAVAGLGGISSPVV